MTEIINLFYLILFLGVSGVGMYICFHILRYSVSRKSGIMTTILFASVFVLFLTANALSFFRIDWQTLLGSAGNYPYIPSAYSGF